MENCKFWEAGRGLKNFWTKVRIDTPYSKSTRTNRFSYVAVAVFKRYTAQIKQETHHEMRILEREGLLSVYLFTLIHRSVDNYG